jgi:hypothetical protein
MQLKHLEYNLNTKNLAAMEMMEATRSATWEMFRICLRRERISIKNETKFIHTTHRDNFHSCKQYDADDHYVCPLEVLRVLNTVGRSIKGLCFEATWRRNEECVELKLFEENIMYHSVLPLHLPITSDGVSICPCPSRQNASVPFHADFQNVPKSFDLIVSKVHFWLEWRISRGPSVFSILRFPDRVACKWGDVHRDVPN